VTAGTNRKISVHSILVAVVILLYPVVAYVAIDHLGIRLASAVLLLLLFGSTLLRVLATRSLRWPLVLQAGAVGLILGAGTWLRSPLYMNLVPALIAATASANFFLSLRATPLIESFARMQKPALPPAEVRYTRAVTHLWGWAMLADSLLCLAVAFQGSMRAWLIVCFPLSYALIGLLFCSEYVVRKRRFGEYSEALLWDRIIRGVLERAVPAARRGALIVYHTVACWGLFCLFTALFILVAPPLWLILKAGGVENVRPVLQLISHRWHRWYVGMLMQIVTPLRFIFIPPRRGAPGAGPVVYISNHNSVVDLLLLTSAIDSFCVMAKRSFRFVPLFGTAMTLLGMIFVDRRRKFESEDVFRVLRARLRAGENVLAFPQGSRALPFSRGTVKRGLFRVIMEERVPVVPVAIVGTNHILKKGQFFFDLTRRCRATVFFLPPMTPGGDPADLADVTAFRDAVVERIGTLLETAADPTRL